MTDLSTSYNAIHQHLSRHFPKTGQCVRCHRTACRTELALIKGREYSRDRNDYLELCVPCHRRMDGNLPPRMFGADNPAVRLTEAIVIEARLLYSSRQLSGRELAKKYGIGKTAMQKAINGDTWQHADGAGHAARADHLFDAVLRAAEAVQAVRNA